MLYKQTSQFFSPSKTKTLRDDKDKSVKKSTSLFFSHKPAIALDLDDTLVHVTPIRPNSGDYFSIRYRRRSLYVQKRPNLKIFLERLSKLFDIFVFTSSQKDYANMIIDKILPQVKSTKRFYRDSCLCQAGYSVKDLSLLKRPMKQVLLVDDMMGSALNNPKSLVRVRPWNGEKDDDLLLGELIDVLEQVSVESDVRTAYIEAVKSGKYKGLSFFY